jgi:YD repeat-containing protein
VTVGLQVTDNVGNTAQTTRTLTVEAAPVASFIASPNPASTGQTVSFDGSDSSDPDGTITRYEWDLDGNGTFEKDTSGTPTTSRSYATGGTIDVKLRVTDSSGHKATTSRLLTINDRPPTASFTLSPNPATTAQTVNFDGSGSSDPEGSITKYEWDLDGDGSFETDTGATATTTASYQSATPVTVRLRVTDNESGADDTSLELILNLPAPPLPLPVPPAAPPAPPGPLVTPVSPSTGKCAAARRKRAQLTKRLRSARRKLARARTAAKRRHYRRLVRKLKAQRRKLQTAGC